MSGGVDSGVSAYILKKLGYSVEAAFMHNWDARDESAGACTVDSDFDSVQKTCRILGISRIHRINCQSAYWQRVFEPTLQAYQSGLSTPNPDVLCNREIKFGHLYRWAVEQEGFDLLATGHYARIHEGRLRQARDLSKDQTYFLAAVNHACFSRVVFPVGDLYKSKVKANLLEESRLYHLRDRKESMGICFVGKRRKFADFVSDFVGDAISGPIVNLNTGQVYDSEHKGFLAYTLGQKALISGAPKKLYVAKKDMRTNTLYVVDSIDHPSLNPTSIRFNAGAWLEDINSISPLFCSTRSVDKHGVKVLKTKRSENQVVVELEQSVFAPCAGQYAVFYSEDEKSNELGRICTGGCPMND